MSNKNSEHPRSGIDSDDVVVIIDQNAPLAAYLGEMARLGLWGCSVADVAYALIEEGVRRAMANDLVPRKYFPVPD